MNIFLVGPMGAGKTTIGKMLAKELGLDFRDSDEAIIQRTGAEIDWIFDLEGEEGFRKREAQMLDELSQLNSVVLATGGGCVLADETRQNLTKRGTVVYLDTPLSVQVERTSKDTQRPLLRDGDPKEVLTRLMTERDPLYRTVADIIVDTKGKNSRGIVREIIDSIN